MKNNCFYIPNIYLMHIKLNDSIKSLCYGITRGFFETESIQKMAAILDRIEQSNIKLVDSVDKIRLKDGRIVFRQRVYFVWFEEIVTICKELDLGFNLTDDIYITSDSYNNLKKDMIFLEKYASDLHMNVDSWLILVFRYYCYIYLKNKKLLDLSDIDEDFFMEIETKRGLLNRAPYFLSICDIAKQKYVILQCFDIENEYLYTIDSKGASSFFNYGFTNITLLRDKKKGVFVRR